MGQKERKPQPPGAKAEPRDERITRREGGSRGGGSVWRGGGSCRSPRAARLRIRRQALADVFPDPCRAIALIAEDRLVLVAPRRDVVGCAGELHSQWSSYTARPSYLVKILAR
jgi:hypothetical protein